MRIVSLACSNTEIVCALGCADRLVGVDDHSDHPHEVVARLPKVGPDLEIDVDEVAALDPDLVLATLTVPGHEKVVARLEAAGLPFLAPEPCSLEDVYRDIRTIGERLGVADRADRLVRQMRAELEDADRPPGADDGDRGADGSRPSILVQWWPKPSIVPGRESWTTDLIRAAGGANPIGSEPVKSRPVPDDELRGIDPDAIVLSWCGVHPDNYRPDVVLEKPAWRELRAVRRGQVFCIPEAFMGRPGPRVVEGYRALRDVVEAVRG